MEDSPQKKFLTIAEVQERWRVGRSTIYSEVARGRLKKTLIAGCVRFAISELERYEKG